jgi:uncharacterized protein
MPQGIVSQIGAVLAHRLSNESDRTILEQFGSELDRDLLMVLPTLSAGQLVVMGVDVPIPITVAVDPPLYQPRSDTPPIRSRS